VVLDKDGEFIAWAEHIEVATARLRATDDAHSVERCADGALMAGKQRGKGRLKREAA
jgi:hypothetical protein